MSNNPPGFEKDNAVTRAARRVQELRATMGTRFDRGLPSGRFDTMGKVEPEPALMDMTNVPIGLDGKPQPMVSTLSPEEVARRNAAWAKETGQHLDSQNNIVSADPDDLSEGGRYDVSGGVPTGAMHRPVAPSRPMVAVVARPTDFGNLQTVDLQKKVVVVDGNTFPFTEEEASSVAIWMIEVVMRGIKEQIAAGLKKYGVGVVASTEATGGDTKGNEGVQSVPGGEASGPIPPAQPNA
jgi:hypothetical protein